MDKKKLKELQTARQAAVDAEAAAGQKVKNLQGKVEIQRERTTQLRAAVEEMTRQDADSWGQFEAGKITAQDREGFVNARKEKVEQLAAEEPRLGALSRMLEKIQREHVAAGQALTGASYDLWHFVKDSFIEELRRDSRIRMIQICVALGKAGAQYVWPQTNNVFTQVYGTQIPHNELIAIAEALDKEFLG